MNLSGKQIGILAAVLLIATGVAAYFLWSNGRPLPGPDSPVYQEYLRNFQVGVAALDAGPTSSKVALAKLTRAVQLIPEEPAGWANLALLELRDNKLEDAAANLKKAQALAPTPEPIEPLLSLLAEKQGRMPDAVAILQKVVKAHPGDLVSINKLAEAVSQKGGPDSDAEYQKLMEQILKVEPNNLPVLVKRAGAAFRRDDMAGLNDSFDQLARLAPNWKTDTRRQLADARAAVKDMPMDVSFQLTRLENLLRGEAGYRRDSLAINPREGIVGTPIYTFLRLTPPRPTPSPPDGDLKFVPEAQEFAALKDKKWDAATAVWLLDGKQLAALVESATNGGIDENVTKAIQPTLLFSNAHEIRSGDGKLVAASFPGAKKNVAPSGAGVLPIDWDNDFRIDLVLAGAGGLRIFHHQVDGSFADVTAQSGLAKDVIAGDYFGAWAADTEMDGDLDIVVARRSGPTLLLRNNRDGTFKALDTFAAVKDVRAFVWADLDNDGAADAIFLDAQGKLHVFANDRSGQFSRWPLPDNVGKCVAVTVADVDNDGTFDIVALRSDGAVLRITDQDKRRAWQVVEFANARVAKDAEPGNAALFAHDLDNNGTLDLVVAGPKSAQVFLADEENKFAPLPAEIALRVVDVLDLDGDGRLDLIGLSPSGQPMRALNQGKKNYHWQTIWPLANPKAGDDRVNSFAIGGEAQVRSGLLVQSQRITGPVVHFGLGEQKAIDVARIIWPTGLGQWEFELASGQTIAAAQRLSGSCPFLFTFDGKAMRFAGDFMWGTPLGMYVNGQNIGDFPQTTEWLKIPGEHLIPRDGYYDVRVHANLWEADYFDQLALIVVDHPPDTEIHVDERFFLTPTKPRLYVTTPAKPVAKAWDHKGADVTDIVSAIDGRYLDRAGRGRFQGVTRDHWVEVDLGDDPPPLLVARGWLHPTNSSINVALSQGKHDAPRPLSLEVPDGKGGWKTALPALGFPAGKNKTMLIRLDGIDGGVPRKLRLRTSMEIYWDFLGTARELDLKLARLHRPTPASAELRFRGVLEMTQKNASSPEVPVYDKVIRGQPWRDLEGYYTRFGDVRELLDKVDDRYVIANAGDEIAFRYPVPPAPPKGWKRDFIWECDGWTRDGDLNTRHGNTVLPLPAHGTKSDDHLPGRLQDDPVYRRFPLDWRNYHTRYVTADLFARGLRIASLPR